MKKAKVIALFSSIALALVLVLPGCAAPEAAPGEVVVKEVEVPELFTVLNPLGVSPEIEIQGISPRLDTLEGKHVLVVYSTGGNKYVMENLAKDLKAAVPGCNWEYYLTEGAWTSPQAVDWAKFETAEAIILGHDY